MVDEPERNDIDLRLRAALRATDHDEVCRRVVTRALAEPHRRSRGRLKGWPMLLVAGAVVLLLALVGYGGRRAGDQPPSDVLTVTSTGALIVVTGQDGRRWIVNSSPQRRSGNFVIVIPE